MQKRRRLLRIDVCDYHKNVICPIYDSTSDVSGQADDPVITYERNGWKELSFSLPYTCNTENGIEKNYRLEYLIADYRLRTIDEDGTDWYIISEPRVNHNGVARTVDVTAGHVSQILKTKNLGLEFSDDEGNNVGTAAQLLDTILNGTGWTAGEVATFMENDGSTEKVRSLVAATKTGAFKMISDMCDLFDAKPVYHGEEKTVDIMPMNPFSRDITYQMIGEHNHMIVGGPIELNGQIPPCVLAGDRVIELRYSRNVSGITRTMNTDNLVTRLYAYGDYGDTDLGMCSLINATHNEYTYQAVGWSYQSGKEFAFVDKDSKTRYFTIDETTTGSDEFVWSDLDPVSRTYVWNTRSEHAYHVYNTAKTPSNTRVYLGSGTRETVKNNTEALMDFSYYEKIGLLTETMFQALAAYQRGLPALKEAQIEASTNFNHALQLLSEVGESSTGFLKLAISSYDADSNGYLILNIDHTKGPENDGVLFRSDYDEAVRRYFQWHVAHELKANGEPKSGIGSVVLIVHDTDPVTWEQFYVQKIDDRTEQYTQIDDTVITRNADYDYLIDGEPRPSQLTMWGKLADMPTLASTDRFYLFCSKSMSGYLGAKQIADETVLENLANQTKLATVEHPTYFQDIADADQYGNPTVSRADIMNSYGWCYVYHSADNQNGQLFMSYDKSGNPYWGKVYVQEEQPVVSGGGQYWLNPKTMRFYYHSVRIETGENNTQVTVDEWCEWTTTEQKRVISDTSLVYYYCLRRDMLYKGLYQYYTHNVTDGGVALPKGNYAIPSPYGFYWLFTTDAVIRNEQITIDGELADNELVVNTDDNLVFWNDDIGTVVPVQSTPFYTIEFAKENLLADVVMNPGGINTTTGDAIESDSTMRTNYFRVYPSQVYAYSLPQTSRIAYYDSERKFISTTTFSGASGTITVPKSNSPGSPTDVVTEARNPKYARIITPGTSLDTDTYYFRLNDYENKLISNDEIYTILSQDDQRGLRKGINYLTMRFAELADSAYLTYLPAYNTSSETLKEAETDLADTLEDLYREGWWQEENYVEGDEAKLYEDALDNLSEIAKPETTYDVDFQDLYGSDAIAGGCAIESADVSWPDVRITDAAHLIDEEMDINIWGYLDKVEKHFVKEWETQVELNTNLSLIGQHTFTDVMSYIAQVANETRAKQSIYQRAASLTGSGTLATNKLEGNIATNTTMLNGAASNWYTDQQGNIVLVSADGTSAMKLTGHGFALAKDKNSDGDWNWRSFGTGSGFSADEITTGVLSAQLIEAGGITTDKIAASFGEALDISSNKAIILSATTDGTRPSGALRTTDSLIEIAAGSGSTPAHINVLTGGELNMQGGTINITSGGNISIGATGTFTVSSNKFNIASDGSVTISGNVTAETGQIAGFTIGSRTENNRTIQYLYHNLSSMSGNTDGVYLGDDGLYIRGTTNNKTSYIKATDDGTLEMNGGILTAGLWTIRDYGMFKQKSGDWPSYLLSASNASDASITETAGDNVYRTILSAYNTPTHQFGSDTYQEYAIEVGENTDGKIAVFSFARERWYTPRVGNYRQVAVLKPRDKTLKDWSQDALLDNSKDATEESAIGTVRRPWTYGYFEHIVAEDIIGSTFTGLAGSAKYIRPLLEPDADDGTYYSSSNGFDFYIYPGSFHLLFIGSENVSTGWAGYVWCDTDLVVHYITLSVGLNGAQYIQIGTDTSHGMYGLGKFSYAPLPNTTAITACCIFMGTKGSWTHTVGSITYDCTGISLPMSMDPTVFD